MPEDDIRKYFSKFGRIEGIELPYDRTKGRRREFCFIIFEMEESADAACRNPKQMIGNRECDVKKAQPQPIAQQMKRQQQGPDGRGPPPVGPGSHAGNGHYESRPPGRGPPRRGPHMPPSEYGWHEGQGYGDAGGWYGLASGGYQQGPPPSAAGPGGYSAGYGAYPAAAYGQSGAGGAAAAGYDAYGYGGYPGYGGDGAYASGYGSGGAGWGYPAYDAADPYGYGPEGGYPPPPGAGSGPSSQGSSHSHPAPSSQSSAGKMNNRRIPSASGYHPYPRSAPNH